MATAKLHVPLLTPLGFLAMLAHFLIREHHKWAKILVTSLPPLEAYSVSSDSMKACSVDVGFQFQIWGLCMKSRISSQ